MTIREANELRGAPPESPDSRPEIAAVEARWQAAWRDGDAAAPPPPEEGRADVQISAVANPLSALLDFDQVRRYVLADSLARFRRRRGDAVLFSLGFAEDASGRRGQLESLGLSVDWSRRFESLGPDSAGWSQQLFLTLLDPGTVYRGENAMLWCDTCRTLLPDAVGNGGSCRLCGGALRQMPAGQWYLRLATNAKTEGEPLDGPAHSSRAPATGGPRDLLGAVEGSELDAKATNGTPLVLFTPFPKRVEDARFVAVSPGHPALESLIADPGTMERIASMRSGSGGGDKRNLSYPSITDTGLWIHVPGVADPLPLIVSLAVDARFGVTAVLGIPSADPLDEQLAQSLPSPPTLRWDVRLKGSEARPTVRFRADSLPVSTLERPGIPLPLILCADCGTAPAPLDALPLSADSECACPKCGKPAQLEPGALDPRVVAWAEMLAAVPPEERAGAAPDHAELRRWAPGLLAIHGTETGAALLCGLTLVEALRDLGLADLTADGVPGARGMITGRIGGAATADDADGPAALSEQFGADALRFGLMHAAAPSKQFDADELAAVVMSSAKFLDRLWAYAEPRLGAPPQPRGASIDASDRSRRRLAKWCEVALRRVTENSEQLAAHRATRNAEMLLARIEDFEQRAREERGEPSAEDSDAIGLALRLLLALLAPIAPHLCEELWERAGNTGQVAQDPWPESVPVSG